MKHDERSRSDERTRSALDDEERERAREHLRRRQETNQGKHRRDPAPRKAHETRETREAHAPAHADRAKRAKTHAHAEARSGRDAQSTRLAASGVITKAAASARYTANLAARLPMSALVVAAAVLLAIVGFAVFQCTRPVDVVQSEPAPVVADVVEDVEEVPVEFEATPAALDGVPEGAGLQTFALAGDEAPAISQEQSTAIESAIAAAEEHGDVSLAFYNIDTGKGISYDADTAVYGASSFKAPYALYVCETQVDTGNIGLDDLCQATSVYDPSSYYNGGAYPLSDLIADAIVYSDNNAFGSLRDAFDSQGYDEWATSLGLNDALYRADSWFPWYCARTSAKVWTEMYSYLQTQSEAAQLLSELTSQTETSFMREALAGTGATVQDKAGWCADSDPRWNGVCDAGIVTLGDKTYILSIMTGMPDGEESYLLYEDIATAVFDARGELD